LTESVSEKRADRISADTEIASAAPERLDLTGERILDAALAQFEEQGIKRSSVEAIARRAGVTRVTVYRRFPRKTALVEAVVAREARRLVAEVDARTSTVDDAEARAVESFVQLIGWLRDHALVRRLLATEPESVLRTLTVDAGPVVAFGTAYIAEQIRRGQREGAFPAYDPEPVAGIFARFIQSLILTPDALGRLDDEATAREFVRAHVAPMLRRDG